MLIRTIPVQARVELAVRLDVRELAAVAGAVGAVAAHGHRRVVEGTRRVGAVGEKFAVLRVLEVAPLRGGRVARDAFAVLARGAEGAGVVDVDGDWARRRRGGRLVRKRAVGFAAGEVVFAEGRGGGVFGGVLGLRAFHFHRGGDVGLLGR